MFRNGGSASLCAVFMVLVALATASTPSSLSPLYWPPGLLADLTALSTYFGPHPDALMAVSPFAASGGSVSGSSNVLAAFAGEFALLNGGNALDACLTTAITQTVLAANSYVNLAGIADIVVHVAKSNTTTSIYGGWGRPSGSQAAAQGVGAGVMVGGFLAAVEAASAAYGALPFARLFDAAEFFASAGSPSEPLRGLNMTALASSPEGMRLKAQILGSPNFTQPELAALLQQLQADGNASRMYQGSFAAAATAAANAAGGNISVASFAAYKPLVQPARRSSGLHAMTAFTGVPSVSIGGVEVQEQAAILSASGLLTAPYNGSLWPPYTQADVPPPPFGGNATLFGCLALVNRFRTAMSVVFLGGVASIQHVAANVFPSIFQTACPDLQTGNDVPHHFQLCRTSATFGRVVWMAMRSNFTAFSATLTNLFAEEQPALRRAAAGTHSDAATAVDVHGNMCSLMHSINTASMWGTGLFVNGVVLSNAAVGAQNRYYIAHNISGNASPLLLPTPTKPAVFASHLSDSQFAVSTIGDSLSPVTLQMVAALLLDVTPLNYSVNQGQFLISQQVTLGSTLNVCDMNCSAAADAYVCQLENAQTTCVAPSFIAAIPPWAGPFATQSGIDRFRDSGLMALSRIRRNASSQSMVVDGAVSPAVNGGSFIGEA